MTLFTHRSANPDFKLRIPANPCESKNANPTRIWIRESKNPDSHANPNPFSGFAHANPWIRITRIPRFAANPYSRILRIQIRWIRKNANPANPGFAWIRESNYFTNLGSQKCESMRARIGTDSRDSPACESMCLWIRAFANLDSHLCESRCESG